jgi:hypothetical protein
LQRLLIVTHRWLGLGLCLLMLAWFGSGMVMLFVPYPGLEPLPAPPFAPGAVAGVTLPAGLAQPSEMTLRWHQGRPRWLVVDGDGHRVVATDGDSAAGGRDHADRAGTIGDGELLTRPDQWTFSGSLRPYFPLVRRALPDGTLEYRSAATREPVLRLGRARRLAIALGPVVHWIYPTVLRRHAQAWQYLVLALACAGALLSASGLVYGLWVQRRAAARFPASPYRRPALRLHHELGLVFGVLACSWTLSGALSFDPGNWSTGDWPDDDEAQRYYGGAALDLARFTRPPGAVAAACAARQPTGALTLITLAGTPWYRCHATAESPPHAWARADAPGPLLPRPPTATLMTAAQAMHPGVPIREASERDRPDAYYYATTRAPSLELPYLVVRYDDRADTAAYIGLRSGELLRRYQRSGRWERWLFHGVHSWDFAPLYRHRALWRATLLLLLGGGAALAASGVWMLLVRLGRRRG